METKTTVDLLTRGSVSIKTQRYLSEGGQEFEVGSPHRKAYVNSERGRREIKEELSEPYLAAVLAVWGSEPTVVEDFPET